MLGTLLPSVLPAFSDPDPGVRMAAGFCVGQFAEFLQPEILLHADQTITALVAQIDELMPGELRCEETAQTHVVDRMCYALQVYVESMDEEDVRPYLEGVARRFELRLVSPNSSKKAMTSAILGLTACAQSAKRSFAPLALRVLTAMRRAMEQSADEWLEVRAAATDCVGVIVAAISPEEFAAASSACGQLEGFCILVLQGMALDEPELREMSFRFFANLATAMKAGFHRMLEQVFKLCMETLEGRTCRDICDSVKDPYAGLDPEEDAEDARRMREMRVPAGLLNEQLAAGHCLRSLVEASGAAFLPFAEAVVVLCLESLCGDDNGDIRELSVELLVALTKSCHASLPRDPTCALAAETRQLLDVALPALVERLEDEEKDVVATACDELTDLFHSLECWDAAEPVFTECLTGWKQFLGNELVCQQGRDEDMGLDDEDVSTADESLMESFAALLGALAAVAGPEFEPPFRPSYPKLLELVKPNSSTTPGMRASAIGAIAEVLSRMGVHVPAATVEPYARGALEACAPGLRDSDKLVRCNSLYTLGVLVQVAYHCVPDVMQATPMIAHAAVQASQAPCQTDEDRQLADNATGVLARILVTVPPAHLDEPPLSTVTLSHAFFASLPVRVDLEELLPTVACVAYLLQSPELMPFAEPIPAAKALLQGLFHPKRHLCVNKIRGQLETTALTLLQTLFHQVPEVRAAVQVPPQARAVLEMPPSA